MASGGGGEGKNSPSSKAKAMAKRIVATILKKWIGKYGGIIFVVLCLIIFLFVGALFAPPVAYANPDAQCVDNSAYKPDPLGNGLNHTNGKPNETVIEILAQVVKQKNADARVELALYEAVADETEYKNLANDGIHGPEDDRNTASTPAQLEAAGHSLDKNPDGSNKYPYDGWGTDHASVGILQQQVGPGFSWGTLDQVMQPAYAAGKFIDTAIPKEKTTPGDAAALAQAVQHASAVNYAKHAAEAEGYIQQAHSGTTEIDNTQSGSGVACTANQTLLETCNPTSQGSQECTISITSHVYGSTATTLYDVSLPIGPDGTTNEAGKAIKAAATEVSIGYPYVWGGGNTKGPTTGQAGKIEGFDCSGLVLYAIYQATGGRINLPHYTVDMVHDSILKQVSAPAPGDLVFYNYPSNIHHVAMYIGTMVKGSDGIWVTSNAPGATRMMIEAPETGQDLHVTPFRTSDGPAFFHPPYEGSISATV